VTRPAAPDGARSAVHGLGVRHDLRVPEQTDPTPKIVMSEDRRRIATYDVRPAGDDGAESGAPVVLAVHGFASSFTANFVRTGWVRDLTRAGVRVIGVDQRGHGASDKPRERDAYSLDLLVEDLRVVLDTYLVMDAAYVGYSLGARVGWRAALEMPDRIRRAVLGGIPDGAPLTRFRTEEARHALATGEAPSDRVTAGYLTMASAVPGNDVLSLVALVEGLRRGGPDDDPDPHDPPQVPVLFCTGSEDGILAGSQRLAAATPGGRFFEIPGRNHFNAPVSRHFRDAAVDFVLGGPPKG